MKHSSEIKSIFLKELTFSKSLRIDKSTNYTIYDKKYYFFNEKNQKIEFYNNNCKTWKIKLGTEYDYIYIFIKDKDKCENILKEIGVEELSSKL